jgi:hypothetical protein
VCNNKGENGSGINLLFTAHGKILINSYFFCSYKDLLADSFDLLYIKDADGHESRVGREKIAIWKRQ